MARFDRNGYGFGGFPPYVPVGQRFRQAGREVARLRKQGKSIEPVLIEGRGRDVARTFWGQAWCTNLEAYSDYSNRLPRGRTYVRNGSVVDLKVGAGRVTALVQGRELYEIEIRVTPLAKKRWRDIVAACAGGVGSLVELLRGKLSERVMQVVTRPATGLFPAPAAIEMSCSCPDWAVMCKHVAASLYGVGARLDHRPELLFTLRGVDATELVSEAATGGRLAAGAMPSARALATSDLSSLFGVEIDDAPDPSPNKRRPTTPLKPKRALRQRSSGTLPGEAPRRARRSKPPSARPDDPPLEARILSLVGLQRGARIEEIAGGLGVSTRELVLAMRRLLADGRLRTQGVKRATRYFPTGRSRLTPPAPGAQTVSPRPRRERRSPSQIDELVERLLAHVRAHPGRRMEHIALGMGVPSGHLPLAMKKLVAARRVRSIGQRRATRYFPL